MDNFTLQHFTTWVNANVHLDDHDRFVPFALDILSDYEELAYYINAGWPRLLDRFYNEREFGGY